MDSTEINFMSTNINSHKDNIEIYIDGACRGNPGRSGIGVIIKNNNINNNTIRTLKKYIGIRTSNQAEYEALITSLHASRQFKDKEILIFTDSLLLANQINGKWRVRNANILPLYNKAKSLLTEYSAIKLNHIPREFNWEADRLANQALESYRGNGKGKAIQGHRAITLEEYNVYKEANIQN